MSGVKGLLARFENANLGAASTPPERGRSPAESLGAGSNGATSPRPLSKVRTSFVAVESKNGQIGLRRDTSGEPSVTKRRTSFSEEDSKTSTKPVFGRQQSFAEEQQAKKDSTVKDSIPEVAVEMEGEQPITRGREPAKRWEPVTPKAKEETKAPVVVPKEVSKTSEPAKPIVQKESKEQKEAKEHKEMKEPAKASSSRTTTKPGPISTAKTTVPPKHSPKKSKSPLPKTPTTPKSVKPSKAAEKQPERKPSRASLASSQTKTPTKPTTTAAHSGPFTTRIGASPPQSGFVKPRPRSPTRPVKLPASLTAHTASSGSKTATGPVQRTEGSRSYSRASAHPPQVSNSLRTQQTTRSPSRVSTTSTSTNPVARKSTTLNKPSSRASIGPPPTQLKKQPSRQSLPAPADEGFLARMMRSTASSASKTADKVPVSPPKATQVKKPVVKHEPPKANLPIREKKAVAKAGPSVAKAKEVVGEAAKHVKSTVKSAGPSRGKKETPIKKSSEKPTAKAVEATPKVEVAEPKKIDEALAAKDDVPATEEPAIVGPTQEEAAEPQSPPKDKAVESVATTEPEAESEPEFTPAESVDGDVAETVKPEEPIVPEPVIEKQATEKPIAEKAIVEEPVVEKPVVEEPVVEAPTAEEPVVKEPVISEPIAEIKEVIEEPVSAPETAPETKESAPVLEEPKTTVKESIVTAEKPKFTIEAEKPTTVEEPAVAPTTPATPKPINFFSEHQDMWAKPQSTSPKKSKKSKAKAKKQETDDDAKAREEITKLNEAMMAGAIESGEQAKKGGFVADDDVE